MIVKTRISATPAARARRAVLPLLFLTSFGFPHVAIGQSLYDVLVSLSDRQQVIEQRALVEARLGNSGKAGDAGAIVPPGIQPLVWKGLEKNFDPAAVDGLDEATRLALLDQAAGVFSRLDTSYLNLDPAELDGEAAGALIPHGRDDFGKLPKATAENYRQVLESLAHQVGGLRVVVWPSAFETRTYEDGTYLTQTVVRDDPQDKNQDKRHGARVVSSPDIPAASLHAPFIGPGNHDSILAEATTDVKITADATIRYSGECTETDANEDEITQRLHDLKVLYRAVYPERVRVDTGKDAGSGAAGQIDGTVVILRRSLWHGIRTDDQTLPKEFAVNDARYHIVGRSKGGSIPLFPKPPAVVVKGKWMTVAGPGNAVPDDPADAASSKDPVRKNFVADGCKYQANSLLPENNRNHSADYPNTYEHQWQIGCRFYSIFKPDFNRGLDSPEYAAKQAANPLPAGEAVPAERAAEGSAPAEAPGGELVLHPRPDLLFGIRLGPGLNGAGDEMISCHVHPDGTFLTNSLGGWLDGDDAARTRFDSAYRLGLAGSATDYRVVYDNDRSRRKQVLPDLAWPMTTTEGTSYNFTRLLHQWDSPRLRQVIGRDFIADIEHTSSHYGYVVKVYRRPAERNLPDRGTLMDTSTLTPIRTWAATHPDEGGSPYLNDAEKLRITGGDDETMVIYTNAPPSETRETGNWWQWTPGEFSWIFKRSEGTTETYKKEIRIKNDVVDGKFRHEAITEITVNGKRTEAKNTSKEDPFVSARRDAAAGD